jgi:NifU-like protein involved in Fe-S cluster formation
MNSSDDFAKRVEAAIKNPKNLGELVGADAVGTVGNEECGDMLRMWVKFKEVEGKRVIDKATFQTFGCETAIAVASLATELISGKTVEEALNMSGDDLAAPLGPLPPLKIHCAQLVEGALRSALAPDEKRAESEKLAPTLIQQFQSPKQESKRIILGSSNERRS